MNERNLLISFLQTFGIILVVIGHANYGNPDFLFRQWIYTFHMPLFVFISGFLLQYTEERKHSTLSASLQNGYGSFIVKKAKRLLLPYAFISSAVFLPKVYFSYLAMRPVAGSWNEWIHMLIYPRDNVIAIYWFFPTLFGVMVVVASLIWITTKLQWRIPVFAALGILLILHVFNPARDIFILNTEGVVFYLFYFVLGICYCHYQKLIDQRLHLNSNGIMCLGIFLSVVFLCIHKYYDMGDWFEVVMALNGITMSISLGYFYIKRNWCFFHHLYGASAAIYIFSWFPQVASQQVLTKIIPLPWSVTMPLATISGIYISLLLYKLIGYVKTRFRYGKYIALLLGQ